MHRHKLMRLNLAEMDSWVGSPRKRMPSGRKIGSKFPFTAVHTIRSLLYLLSVAAGAWMKKSLDSKEL
jgi:hypothetical protein